MKMFSSVLQVYYKNPLSKDVEENVKKKKKQPKKPVSEDLHAFVYV